jgi:UDPglucose 6-dehydrogenase
MFSYINIIGYGYVGGSIGYLCKRREIAYTITDKSDKTGNNEVAYFNDLANTIEESEKSNSVNYYFICVPTPSMYNYKCDTSIVESIFNTLSERCTKRTIVIIKSTVSPGTTRKLHNSNKNGNIFVFFSPEFLTEKNAKCDVLNEKKLILGSAADTKNIYAFDIVSLMYNSKEITFCQYEYAEMMKYTINVYLAQKVHFFNEIYDICESMGISYDNVKDLVLMDKRISPSHTSVPGHDGKFGFGGSCLVKETKGMVYLKEELGLDTDCLNSMLELNSLRRGDSC